MDADTGVPSSGTGLGLAIVREVAEAQSASVSVERSPMGGARFIVNFASALHQKGINGTV